MGEFAKNVRRSLIKGPNQRDFDRSVWETQRGNPALDEEDRRLLPAGLLFDDLLSSLRKQIQLSSIELRPSATARFAIAIATLNLVRIHEELKVPKPKKGELADLYISTEFAKTVQLPNGQAFSADELLTGTGDGMRHMLRELQNHERHTSSRSEYEATDADVDRISQELNCAILYQCAVEQWNDCVGNGYGLSKHKDGIAVSPYDPDLEIARIVSIYRRLNISLFDTMHVAEWWMYRLPRSAKEKISEIPLVIKTHGFDRIERIDLGFSQKALDAAVDGVAAKLWLQHSYYQRFLEEPLPKLNGFTLNQVINAWRLLQSLSRAIVNSLRPINEGDLRGLLGYAPRISKTTLRSTLAKALSLDVHRSQSLLDVFVFEGLPSQELWFQPLVRMEEDYCLVTPCIHAVQLQRIVEGWMRQGGVDLERRGPEFEQFCRDDLKLCLKISPIKASASVVDRAVEFTPVGARKEEIDLVTLIGNTVLLIEAKCILWPDDALQFANYRDTIEKAATQIKRKRDAVSSDRDGFSERLRQLGYEIPKTFDIACCVLTNSAVYSGFPIDGVPIVDLSILGSFLKNEHIKAESRQAGKSIYKHAIQFYRNAEEAGKIIAEYLSSPPQLIDTKQFVHLRELYFPVTSPEFGKFIQQTYRVEIDNAEMLKRYGPRDDSSTVNT